LTCASCTAAGSGCSFCASTDSGYAFCVNGTNACNSNDTIASAGCTAELQSLTSICDALSCNQCLNGAGGNADCSYCMDSGTPHCTALLCENQIYDQGTCAAPGPCEGLSCTACQSNTQCSYCSYYDQFGDGYGVCVAGAKMCTHNDSVTASGCAALPLDPCPLLACGQCVDSDNCHWCVSGSVGTCTSTTCNANVTEILDDTMCAAATSPCANLTDCAGCFKTLGCQFCADKTQDIAICVASTANCGTATITAASCTNATGMAPPPPPPKSPATPLPPGVSKTLMPTQTAKPISGSTPATVTTKATSTTAGANNAKPADAALFGLSVLVAIVAAALTF